jgi:hypothetical protein
VEFGSTEVERVIGDWRGHVRGVVRRVREGGRKGGEEVSGLAERTGRIVSAFTPFERQVPVPGITHPAPSSTTSQPFSQPPPKPSSPFTPLFHLPTSTSPHLAGFQGLTGA